MFLATPLPTITLLDMMVPMELPEKSPTTPASRPLEAMLSTTLTSIDPLQRGSSKALPRIAKVSEVTAMGLTAITILSMTIEVAVTPLSLGTTALSATTQAEVTTTSPAATPTSTVMVTIMAATPSSTIALGIMIQPRLTTTFPATTLALGIGITTVATLSSTTALGVRIDREAIKLSREPPPAQNLGTTAKPPRLLPLGIPKSPVATQMSLETPPTPESIIIPQAQVSMAILLSFTRLSLLFLRSHLPKGLLSWHCLEKSLNRQLLALQLLKEYLPYHRFLN